MKTVRIFYHFLLLDREPPFLDNELLITMSAVFVVSTQTFVIVSEFCFRFDRVFIGE
jgi:hypothetical protein